jgi:membrane protein YdbS with pleckstrin-like domain
MKEKFGYKSDMPVDYGFLLGMLGIVPTILAIPTYYLAGRFHIIKQEVAVKEGKMTHTLMRQKT